jgi:V8-like Glu-specific endopeptidase
MLKTPGALIFIFLVPLSCAAGTDDSTSPTALRDLQGTPAHPSIVRNGQSFSWQRSIPVSQMRGILSGKVIPDRARTLDPVVHAQYQQYLDGLSDAQFADKLRLVVLFQDNEYLQDLPPDAATVARIRNEARTASVIDPPASALPRTALPSQIQETSSALLVDTRVKFDNFHQPGSSILLIHTDFTPPMPGYSSACSGAIIGPHSAIGAAHCFYDEPTHTWKGFQSGATGVDDLRSPNFPWGTFDCFGIAIYSAFETDPNVVSQWDVAALDFAGCGDNPAATGAGWLGTTNGFSPGSTPLTSLGYANSPTTCDFNEVCGMNGTASASGQFLQSSNIFTKGGDSGGPLFITSSLQLVGNAIAVDTNTSYYRWFNSAPYALFHIFDPSRWP